MNKRFLTILMSAACLGLVAISFQNCQPVQNNDVEESVPESVRGDITNQTHALLQDDASKLASVVTQSVAASTNSTVGCSLVIDHTKSSERQIDLGQVANVLSCDQLCAKAKVSLQLSSSVDASCQKTSGGQSFSPAESVSPTPQSAISAGIGPFKNASFHSVAIYESNTDHSKSGVVKVHLSGKGPAVLLLSSYEGTGWSVTQDAGVQLLGVYVNGYDAQKVSSKAHKTQYGTYAQQGKSLISVFSHGPYPALTSPQQASDIMFIANLALKKISKPEQCVALLGKPENFPPSNQAINDYSRCEKLIRNLQFRQEAKKLSGLELKSIQGDYTAKASYTIKVEELHGQCLTQDTIRGGGGSPNATQNECVAICKQSIAEAPAAATVYDCRWVSGDQDIIIQKGRKPIVAVGECISQDSVRGAGQYPKQTRAQCVNICKKNIAEAPAQALVHDCRWLSDGQDIVIQKGRKPIAPIGECVPQDTIRGGAIQKTTRAQCLPICEKFNSSASRNAKVYDCRWVHGSLDVVLVKGREPVATAALGECISQDSVRGGGQYPKQTRAQCVSICKKNIAEAPARATVYDCRWLSGGKDIIIQKGRAPISVGVPSNTSATASTIAFCSGTYVDSNIVFSGGHTLASCKAFCKDLLAQDSAKNPLAKCSYTSPQRVETAIYTKK